jgi:Putative Actinobacterial Holin-X, holin superfamily III
MQIGDEQARGVESASTVELVNRAVEQTSLIIRQELALARAEITRKAKRAVLGTMLTIVAATIATVALLCGVAAGIAGLAGVVPTWAAALIVAGVLLAGAGLVGAVAARSFSKSAPSTPPDVIASVKADVTEIKEQLKR